MDWKWRDPRHQQSHISLGIRRYSVLLPKPGTSLKQHHTQRVDAHMMNGAVWKGQPHKGQPQSEPPPDETRHRKLGKRETSFYQQDMVPFFPTLSSALLWWVCDITDFSLKHSLIPVFTPTSNHNPPSVWGTTILCYGNECKTTKAQKLV